MKFTSKLQVIKGLLGTGILIPYPAGLEVDEATEYSIEIKKKSKPKTLDANAYLWVLCQKIAEKLTVGGSYTSKEDVYRRCIRDAGSYITMPVKENLVEHWKEIWESKGIGWVCEELGACRKTKGYVNVMNYYGSSVYSREEMSRLLDCVVDEAERLGVETRDENDINSLLDSWDETQ